MKAYNQPPQIRYSNPEDGENPALVRFAELNERIDYSDLFPDERPFRLVYLPRTDTNEVFVHLYNTTQLGLILRYYGVTSGDRPEPVSKASASRSALVRDTRQLPDGYDAYLLRIDLDEKMDGERTKFSRLDSIAVAAYAGSEPASPGGIYVGGKGPRQDGSRYLPFSHNGRSFQRLVIATCDPEEDIRPLAAATGLELAEAYFGKLGSVIALGVPPGMSLNSGVDATETIRQKGQTGGGTVDEDYIISLFAPEKPTDTGQQPAGTTTAVPDGLTDFRPPQADQFDPKQPPLTVALIDSGIDYGKANAGYWPPTRYERGADTEYVTPGRYGYDFIHRREEPADEAPHGTYVAAAVLNQYTAARPLQLLHMKVFGKEGVASYFGSLVSLYEATLAGARVINMSWGFYQKSEPKALYCAIKTAADRGVLMVASAGNDTKNLDADPQWPAAFADDFPCNLVTVASYHFPDPRRADPATIALTQQSNFGQWEVPLAAFLTSPVPRFGSGETHFPVGTSISAAVVSGQLANWLAEQPGGTLARFRKDRYRTTNSLAAGVTRGSYLPHV